MLQDSGMHTASVDSLATEPQSNAQLDQQEDQLPDAAVAHHDSNAVLSPTGYILGFLHPQSSAEAQLNAQRDELQPSASPEAFSDAELSDPQQARNAEARSTPQPSPAGDSAAQSMASNSLDHDQQPPVRSSTQPAQQGVLSSISQDASAEQARARSPLQDSAQQASSSSSAHDSNSPTTSAQRSSSQSQSELRPHSQSGSSAIGSDPNGTDGLSTTDRLRSDTDTSQQAAGSGLSQQQPFSPSTSLQQAAEAQHAQHAPAVSSQGEDTQHAQRAPAMSSQFEEAQHAQHASGQDVKRGRPARSAAVKLLIAFMGALQASQYAVDAFVNSTLQYYRYDRWYPMVPQRLCQQHLAVQQVRCDRHWELTLHGSLVTTLQDLQASQYQ